ncbi:enoyl-ACP reductase FabI [Desulfoplanes formicivorans]|uniref:Enoyl-[acyl-carrier-protein] reductase [NADH] n=1 Tax=Desulfoplanes formicivorans TaxID=1592317 RepID=A0A194AEF0_9BACT|nr:enoyl-ACP reductase [Desulfoplanes formicivorans]GAU07496.1 enoyl-ACP reductase [Desulfoplanes formicivorans]
MLLQGKKALIFGIANERSIAYGIASQMKQQGARLAFSYAGEAIKKRIDPIGEELGADFLVQCDVTSDEDVTRCADTVRDHWGDIDILVHSVAFANRDDLKGRFIDTSRDGFLLAQNISAYSLVSLCKAFEPMMNQGGSVMAMTYYGSEKVITNYNVMGVAKATLEACVRYLAADLGEKGIRINALSAGPIKTLASSGISGFKTILHTIEERAPLHRNVTQNDVGKAALYLASDLSSGTTGEIIYVDSGYNIMGI